MNWLPVLLNALPGIFGLFGGGKGGSRQEDIKKTSSLTPEQQQVASALSQLLSSNIGQPLPTYQGQLTAPLQPLQTTAIEQMGQLLGGPTMQTLDLGAMPQYGTPLQGQIEASLATLLAGRPTTDINGKATEDYYKQRIEAPALRTFQETVLPRIRDEAISTGNFYSRARAEAEGRAASDLAAALAGERANLVYADEQARRQLAESAANRALSAATPALQAAWQPYQAAMAGREQAYNEAQANWQRSLDTFANRMGALQQAMQFGGVAQQTEQDALNAALQQWTASQPWNSPYLQMALSFLGVPMLAAYQPAQQVSPLATAIEAAAPLLSGLLQGGYFQRPAATPAVAAPAVTTEASTPTTMRRWLFY